MEKETKNKIVTIAFAAVLLAACMAVEHFCRIASWQLLLLYLVPFLLAGAETLKEAAEGLFEGGVLEEDFLMSIATIGALGIGFLPGTEPQFAEAVFVMLFFQVGELFEDLAEGKSRRSISHLLDIRPDSACVLRDGVWTQVSPNTVEVGETIIVRPGEKVPMDGLVLKGESDLDTAALTGESVPRRIYAGEEIFSGTINISAPLEIRVTRLFGESTASRILELVENAASNKSSGERFITRFARVYTPVVAGLAVLLAVVPPLLSGDFGGVFHIWLYRALTFLIVSCPCALVISVPLAFFSGIGRASRRGILVKGGNWLEVLSRTGTVVFDKTGTLTEGVFEVTAIHPEKLSERELLHIAAHVEKHSSHPVAMSLKRAFDMDGDDGCSVEQIEEIPGKGARATVNGKSVYVGNTRLMDELGVEWKACEKTGTVIHIASDGEYEGHIVISDRIKEGAKDALDELRSLGVHDMVMLTGDNSDTAGEVAGELGLSGFRAELLPEGKVSELRGLLDGKAEGESLAFAGDGINDAPVLALADVGIAMGALGSDAAIEAADVVLMDDKLSRLGEAIRIARKTVGVARQNTVFTIAVKLAVLVLASFGLAPMGLAVFADVGVTVLAVLNSSRL